MTDQNLVDQALPAMSVETQLALLRRDVGKMKSLLEIRGTDHEARLRKLEQFKWIILGAATASAGGVGALVAQVLQ